MTKSRMTDDEGMAKLPAFNGYGAKQRMTKNARSSHNWVWALDFGH
jgi:hypothetical protein